MIQLAGTTLVIVWCSRASVGVREAAASTGLKQDHALSGEQIRVSVVDVEYRIPSTSHWF